MIYDSNEDTIILNNDNVNNDKHPIKISKDITIDGNNHVLDGNYKSNIIQSTSKITLKNIVFKNGYSEYGGVLEVKNAIIINCTFVNNKAKYCGGAIDITNGKIFNSKFINNHADVEGAVYQTRSTISNSFFTNNTASLGGGVYQVTGSTISSSEFISNHADSGGAAESFFSDVLNSNFVNNDAKYEGGALYHFYGNVKNSKFINNSAPYGSAMYRVDCNIENCTFENNTGTVIAPENSNILPDDKISDKNYSASSDDNGNDKSNKFKINSTNTGNPLALLLISLMLPLRKIKR